MIVPTNEEFVIASDTREIVEAKTEKQELIFITDGAEKL